MADAAQIAVGVDTPHLINSGITAFRKLESSLPGLKLRLDANSFTGPLGRITGATQDFERSLAAANARVITFGASAGILFAIEKGFKSLVKSTIDTEKSLADINVILRLNTQNLSNFGRELANIAKSTGQSFQEVTRSAIELSRQGLGVEETLKRTRNALILTRLSGLDAVSSVEALTAAVNSFGKTALDSTSIINKFAAVDAAFAVSSADLAEALKRVASTAEDAGLSLDQLIGLVTATQQITARGGAVIANAYKTIFSRVGNSETIESLQALGVRIEETQSGFEKLRVASEAYSKADPSTANKIKQLLGGVYQINIVSAALSELSKKNNLVEQATRKSTDATNEAIVRNELLNETLAALANKTMVSLLQASSKIGTSVLGPSMKTLLGTANSVLSFITPKDSEAAGANIGAGIIKGIGQFISGPGLSIIGATIIKLLVTFGQQAIGFAKTFFSLETSFLSGRLEYNNALKASNAILSEQPLIMQGVLRGTMSIAQAEKEVLNLLRQQAILRAQTPIVAGVIAQAAITQGVKIPRFAANPLEDAIQREISAGVPSSSVRVGQNKSLENSSNPLGLGVYNTVDEPGGLAQGMRSVNRLVNGGVPNFAGEPLLDLSSFPPLFSSKKLGASAFTRNMVEPNSSETSYPYAGKIPGELLKNSLENYDKVIAGSFDRQLKQAATSAPIIISGGILAKSAQEYETVIARSFDRQLKQAATSASIIPFASQQPFVPYAGYTQSAMSQGGSTPADKALSIYKYGALPPTTPFQSLTESAEAKAARDSKRTTIGLASSFLSPIVASTIAEFIDQSSKGGRVSASSVKGLGDIGSFAGMGALFGGPGMVIGAGLGGVSAAYRIFREMSDDLPEFTARMRSAEEALSKTSDGLQIFVQTSEQIKGILTGEVTKPGLNEFVALKSKRLSSFSQLKQRDRSTLLRGIQSGNPQDVTDAISEILRNQQSDVSVSGFGAELVNFSQKGYKGEQSGELLSSISNKFLDFKTRTGETVRERIINDPEYRKKFQAGLGGIINPATVTSSDFGDAYTPASINRKGLINFIDKTSEIAQNRNAVRESFQTVAGNDVKPLQDIVKSFDSFVNGAERLKEQADELNSSAKKAAGEIINLNKAIREAAFGSDLFTLRLTSNYDRMRLDAQQESNISRIRGEGFIDLNKPFLSAESLLPYQTQLQNQNLESSMYDKRLGIQKGFRTGLSNSIGGFIKGVPTKDDKESALQLISLGQTLQGQINNPQQMLGTIEAFRNKVGTRTDSLGSQPFREKWEPFVDGLILAIKENSDNLKNLETEWTNGISVINEQTEWEKRRLEQDRKLGFGGAGFTQFIGTGMSNSIFAAQQQRRLGSNSFQRGLGTEQIANIAQSMGNISPEMREQLINLTEIGLNKIGVTGAEARSMAETKVNAQYPTKLGVSTVNIPTITRDQVVKNKVAESNTGLGIALENANIEMDAMVKGGHAFQEEMNAAKKEVIELQIRLGQFSFKSLGGSFLDELKYGPKEFYRELNNGAIELGQTLKSTFADSFKEFSRGTKSAGDALRDFALGFAYKISDKLIDMSTNQIFGFLQSGISSFSKGRGYNKGGLVKRFAGGGMVTGGSGVIDDIPARLNAGEYVIRKEAVNQVGPGFLDAINGNANIRLNNSFTYDNPARPTSGVFDIDPRLSSYALDDENNPQNALRMRREDLLYSYLRDKDIYEEQKRDTIKQVKRQKRNILISSYISAATSVAGAYAGSYSGSKLGPAQSGATLSGRGYQGTYMGKGMAEGGMVGDSIPALLTGGEYVMSRQAVATHGVSFFNSINSGRGYAMGGLVGRDVSGADSNLTQKMNESAGKLLEAADSIKSSFSNNRGTGKDLVTASSPITNNVSINITLEKDGNVKSDTKSGSGNNNDQDSKNNNQQENAKKLGEMIQVVVLKEIIKQQTQGGLLSRN